MHLEGKAPSLPEPLLPGRVPELKFDADPLLHLKKVDIEVHTHGLVDGVQEHVFGVALH